MCKEIASKIKNHYETIVGTVRTFNILNFPEATILYMQKLELIVMGSKVRRLTGPAVLNFSGKRILEKAFNVSTYLSAVALPALYIIWDSRWDRDTFLPHLST